MDPAPLGPTHPRNLGEFRIDGVLGEGGSGVVYDATWGPRRVALKVLHAHLADTERVRAQFMAEAQRLQQITHSSVVKVLNVGALPDNRPFLAMERLEGETLASVLSNGPLPLVAALELFAELCSAVGALHEQGLIHRDLKPENVFIVANKHAVLLDFGIAKDLAEPSSTTTMEGGVRGTPAYMAPERFFGQPASLATDIYELAVTLYAMLAGRLPWDDLADPEARLSPRSLNAPEIGANVPDELDVEIRRALSTRAQNRPPNAPSFLEAVRAAAGSAAPTAGETARMRPTNDAVLASVTKSDASRKHNVPEAHATTLGSQSSKPQPTETRKPWFAERQATTDRGKTPLAWAPSPRSDAEASAEPERAPRQRWPIVVAGVGAVALAGGLVAWRLSANDDARTDTRATSLTPAVPDSPGPKVRPEDDPWDKKPYAIASGEGEAAKEDVVPEIVTSGAEVPLEVARAEAHAAIAHLPADTRMVIDVLVGPLRRDSRFTPIFGKIGDVPQVKLAMAELPACVKSMVASAEWFVFGSAGFDASEQGTLIVRGRWTRKNLEGCFAHQSQEHDLRDGSKILQLPHIGWVDFLDEHTAYISVRQDLAAAQVHANVKSAKPLTPTLRALLATLPAQRMVTFVFDGVGNVDWPEGTLSKGSDLAAWVQTTKDGVAFDVAIDAKREPAAIDLQKKLDTEVSEVFADASKAVADIRVTRERARVKIGGTVSSLILGMVPAAIPTEP
ncbi:MAG: serine/threonine protein kinase [Kofleriaceae bacterium]